MTIASRDLIDDVPLASMSSFKADPAPVVRLLSVYRFMIMRDCRFG